MKEHVRVINKGFCFNRIIYF